jgi:hypothetical protein
MSIPWKSLFQHPAKALRYRNNDLFVVTSSRRVIVSSGFVLFVSSW